VATFLAIQQRVQTWLRDLPADTVAEIPALINEAQRELQRQYNFRVMQASAQFTTVAAANTLGTVTDFKEPRRRPFWTDNDGSTHSIQWQPSLDYLVQRYDDTSTGEPRYVFWSSVDSSNIVTLQVYPKSDSLSLWLGGEYRVTVPYWKRLPALSAGSDTNWFTVNADKYLRLHAVGWATLLNIDEARGATYLRAADVEAQRLISADKMAVVQQPEALPYSTDAETQARCGPGWWSW
jgi:hypothetical protein